MMTLNGLKTLERRINRLEQNIVDEDVDVDPLSKLVDTLKSKETQNKKMQMAQILEHYVTDVYKNFENKLSDNDLVKLIIFSIKYVESNHMSIAKTLGIKSGSEFKRSLCRTLVQNIIDSFTNEFIENIINDITCMICPKKILKEIEVPVPKKGFFIKK